MSYATILVHAASDADAQARIALAADLARRLGAGLTGVAARDVGPVTPPPAGAAFATNPAVMAEMIAVEAEEIRAELAAAQDLFQAVAEAVDPGLTPGLAWRASADAPTRTLAREARAADLLVVGRLPDGALPARHADPGDVLMRAGRPVLVAPPGVSRLEAARVVVAWKDGREARRALADALPLLKRASGVLVFEACRDPDARAAALPALEDVVRHLVRHGVDAAAKVETLQAGTVADALVSAARRHGADLIVAGGYGHTRLREWVFGGVTRSLLRQCPICCLLSH